MNIGEEYLNTVIKRVKYYKELGEKTFDQLEEKDFHWQPSSESTSIAVIIQHISGNMLSRWTNFLTEDGEKDWRHRDDEFEAHDFSKQQLLEIWEKGWDCFLNALISLTPADLIKTILIRKESMTAIDAINRQLAHYPYHIGQIVYIGRIAGMSNGKIYPFQSGILSSTTREIRRRTRLKNFQANTSLQFD